MHNPKEDNVQIMRAHEYGDFYLMLTITKNTQRKYHFPFTFVHLQNLRREYLVTLSNTMVFLFLIINNKVKKLTSNLETVNDTPVNLTNNMEFHLFQRYFELYIIQSCLFSNYIKEAAQPVYAFRLAKLKLY